jgi:hypothetical protein
MKKLIIEYKVNENSPHLYIDRGDLPIILQEENDLIIRDVSYLNNIFLKYVPESLLSRLLLNLNLEHYLDKVIEYKNSLFIINEENLSNFILKNSGFIKDKIKMLKQKLNNSDYKITKCYEAFIRQQPLPYNLEELSAQRDAWRAEINQLEEELKAL